MLVLRGSAHAASERGAPIARTRSTAHVFVRRVKRAQEADYIGLTLMAGAVTPTLSCRSRAELGYRRATTTIVCFGSIWRQVFCAGQTWNVSVVGTRSP